MSDGFHQTQISVEGVLDQSFTITGSGAAADFDTVAAKMPELLQLLVYDLYRRTLVDVVVAVEQFFIFRNQN